MSIARPREWLGEMDETMPAGEWGCGGGHGSKKKNEARLPLREQLVRLYVGISRKKFSKD